MSLITVSEVRENLGNAYSTEPGDTTIQNFIDKREAELKDLIGVEDLTSTSYQSFLKRWLISKVSIDVLRWDMLGKDSADALDYTIGELRESKSTNIKLKQEWISALENSATRALQEYFTKTVSFKAVSP